MPVARPSQAVIMAQKGHPARNPSVLHRLRTAFLTSLVGLAMFFQSGPLPAQFPAEDLVPSDEESAEPAPDAKAGPNTELVVQQQEISDKFKHLEEVLLRMAELSAGTDPRRAALLRKAVAQSKERLINVQFETLVSLLDKDQLFQAIENQGVVNQDLKSLLELLLSEDRGRRIESEKARIREYLKRLNEIIKQQKGIQGRTAGGAETKKLAGEQEKLAQKTGGLADDIKQNEEGGADSRDEQSRPEDQKQPGPKPAQPAEKKDGGAEGKDGKAQSKPQEAEGKEKEGSEPGSRSDHKPEDKAGKDKSGSEDKGKPAAESQAKTPADTQGGKKESSENRGAHPGGEKSEPKGQSQSQEQGQSQSEEQSESSGEQENPARKRLDAARQRMREAEEKLEKAEREGAVDKQEEAIRELEQAKADLEEILRQLREEEVGRMLALLETRFRKMLQMQREVYDGTLRLDKVPSSDRAHSHDIEAGRLSGKEADIVMEADKALTLMREDGTAVAFPEAVEQIREDMEQVVQRLAQSRVDRMTQGIEEDIIAALEEMIEALKKAQEELQQKQQQGPPPEGEPQDPPLVELLAELKMIRALQMRVNNRTDRYSKLVEGEQATGKELVEALIRLADRQERIFRITRDLQRERNR
ncbi:MAG: hypothetical protein HUU20_01020 [Pirellulales bacterium]|nr:hypothetical protein [Pirellulales bacterium]